MRELAPGMVVAGYRIVALVGRGGMGVVYRAFQARLERVVALKVIAPQLLDDEDVRRRFLAEARAAASVDHPHVIPVYDAGDEDGVAYIAMRYVDGDDLRSMVRRGGPLDPAQAAEFVGQAGAALDAIHRAGFVHRDVKPANLLIDPEGHVYVTDFGLAKAALTHGTATGQWVGSLDYVAPEQIRGGRIDARADVYALGGVLHFALTGHVPFDRDGDEAKLWAQLSAPPPVPSALRRGLRGEFDIAVARAMAKTPEERYPSAGDLGRAARAAALGRMPSEPERMVARGAAAPDAAPTEPGLAAEAETRTAARPGPARPPTRVPLLAGGVLAVLALAVALALAARDDRSPGAGTGPTPTATPTSTPKPSATPAPPAVTAKVTKRIEDVADRPGGIALAGGDLWISSSRQPYLTRVVEATGRKRARHPKVGTDVAAIVAYGGDVWVALGSNREVVRLNGETGRVRKRYAVPGDARRLAIERHGVWVSTRSNAGIPGYIFQLDRRTGRLLDTLQVNEGVGGLLAAAGAVWYVKRDSAKLARLQPGDETGEDFTTLTAPARSMRYGNASIFIVTETEDTVMRVDVDGRGQVTGTAGHSPAQALYAGGFVWVASRNDHKVYVLDPETLQEVAKPIPVGLNPIGMVARGNAIWVIGTGDNSLTRIDYR